MLESVISVHTGVPTCVDPQFTSRADIKRTGAFSAATPIPFTAIMSGEDIALLVKVNFPEKYPADIGRNLIRSTTDAPGAMTIAEKSDEKAGSLLVADAIRNVSFPSLYIVTSVDVGVPTSVVPQFTTREAVARIAPLPRLFTKIVSGEVVELLLKINFPESALIAVG